MVNNIKPEEPLEIVIRISKGKIISSIIVTIFLLYIIYKYLIKDKRQDLYETTYNERRFDAAKKEHEKIIQNKNIPSSVEINDNKVNGSKVQKSPKINDSLENDKKEIGIFKEKEEKQIQSNNKAKEKMKKDNDYLAHRKNDDDFEIKNQNYMEKQNQLKMSIEINEKKI